MVYGLMFETSANMATEIDDMKMSEDRLMVAVRVRPLNKGETQRVIHVINDKNNNKKQPFNGVPGTLISELVNYHLEFQYKTALLNFFKHKCVKIHHYLHIFGLGIIPSKIKVKAVAVEEATRDGPRKRASERIYTYDRAFGEESTQEEVYESTTSNLVRAVLSGYNGAVFAYGATGAGKTYTMTGGPRDAGLMERAITGLFDAVQATANPEDYTVTMSYLEIYNEIIRDLLNPATTSSSSGSAGGGLELREDSGGRAAVAGLSAIRVHSASEALPLLQRGGKVRVVEPTAANKTSSRSHALLSVIVTSRSLGSSGEGSSGENGVASGRLFLVDLAGSERAHVARSKGRRLQEGAHINRSLLALANCITALSGGARYVNYRDSKLTRLLKEALSGNCKTVMVAHVSPSLENREESRNTLLYADRANHITNKVKRNVLDTDYHVTQYRTVINELKDEIARLRTKMKEERPRSGVAAEQNANNPQKNNEMKTLRHAIVGTFQEQMRLRKKLMELDSHLLGLAMDAERQHLVISHWESRNNRLYNAPTTSRISTQQSYRSATAEEGTVAVEQAWAELAALEQDQERARADRAAGERELEIVRQRGAALEDELPSRTSSEEERELLALACRVHELQADKLALQGERASRAADLRRRDLQLLRYDRQRQLSDEIITRQRQIMDEGGMKLPPDLQELYTLYQQEIHAATYTDSAMVFNSYTLPPISSNMVESVQWSSGSSGSGRGSSSGGDSEWLGGGSPARRLLGAPVQPPLRLPRLPRTPAS
ncbi:kinesin-like protein KIF19 [Arctopsyche grandis]|uniref:kinesin-like protein KIF19 n=1 Tax=Arctopsyche grandis TaxID=121162 RepID=UPI00406D803A